MLASIELFVTHNNSTHRIFPAQCGRGFLGKTTNDSNQGTKYFYYLKKNLNMIQLQIINNMVSTCYEIVCVKNIFVNYFLFFFS